jgi:oligopeptide transport system ATP-binding protein
MSAAAPLLSVRELRVSYRAGLAHERLHAVDGVSFELGSGETLAIVGESGSGKSSIARALLRLTPADGGEARFGGSDLLQASAAQLHSLRRSVQLIFQDPGSSLDPRMSIGESIAEPLRVFEPGLSAKERRARVSAMLEQVGLAADQLARLPHEFSGGQAQRIAIARALILRPALLICDEPLSALDVSIKSQIGNLLKDLQEQLRLSLLFISHDLTAVRFASDRVLVLYLGRVMEMGAAEELFARARHPYTRALLQAVPVPDPRAARARRARPLEGELPSPLAPPSGCVFRTRCPHALERCALERPALRRIGASEVACHRAEELAPS